MSGVDYDEAARAILFGNLTVTDLLDKYGLVFRKIRQLLTSKMPFLRRLPMEMEKSRMNCHGLLCEFKMY